MWNVNMYLESGRKNQEFEFEDLVKPGLFKKMLQNSLTEAEAFLEKMVNCDNQRELSIIGKKVDESLMSATFDLSGFWTYGGRMVNGVYDRTVSLLKRAHELFGRNKESDGYFESCFDIFREAVEKRLEYLQRCAQRHQPELIGGGGIA